MKTKFNNFVKKIKNWLSSLSKWAKNHKYLLFYFISLICLFVFSIQSCSNKNTAKAETTTVNTYYSFYIPYTQNLKSRRVDYTAMLGTVQVDESGNLVSFVTYTVESRTVGTETFYTHKPYVNNIVYDSETGRYLTYTEMAFVNEDNHPVVVSANISLYGNMLPYTADYGIISAYNNLIVVAYYNSDAVEIFRVVYTLGYFEFVGYNYRFTPLILKVQGSGDNYNLGYYDGYNEGKRVGFEEGAAAELSPIRVIANGVNSLLDIKIFGNVSLSTVLSISFGCIMLGLVIKIFLGG